MPEFDNREAQLIEALKGLSHEQMADLSAFVGALLYDRDHSGANTAQKWRDEMEQYYAQKEKVAA